MEKGAPAPLVEDIGRYGRVVARVDVQGGDLGAMLISGGLG